jgi:ribonuclease P protein subunit RPR2
MQITIVSRLMNRVDTSTDVKKRERLKELAGERVRILIEHARKDTRDVLAARHARAAKEMAMHFRLRLPYEIRQLYCKKCKQMIIPGKSSRVRLGRSNTKAVRITCLKCGHVYRKVLSAE